MIHDMTGYCAPTRPPLLIDNRTIDRMIRAQNQTQLDFGTVPALDDTFGVVLISTIICTAFWGIGTAQLYWFYNTYWRRDSNALKLLVAFAWGCDTLQQILLGHLVYYFLIQSYFNPQGLDKYIWSLNVQSLGEALTCLAVQGFYVRRIWILSGGGHIRTILAALPVLAKFGCSLAYLGKSFRLANQNLSVAVSELHELTIAIAGWAAVGDIVIAITMLHLLYTSRSGYSATDSLINRLMMYTINTGLATSLCAILNVITAVVSPKNFIYSAFYFITAKLYVNAMLASLNARKRFSSQAAEVSGGFSTFATSARDVQLVRLHQTDVEAPLGGATHDGFHDQSSSNLKRKNGEII
ncbi:hypothetical protein D9613_011699 [Agrocybe pediades]|uniref:DUF6534 domain-containing protein n=1 Tax=Agrocybe pediades TaxID=84607 RepID=A0A8H4QWV6_9AGAR|nr:hypothetical protein D9613_011699 [Agrocybe pediades]